jgi:uncharacterized RDD family membrane protein YckC
VKCPKCGYLGFDTGDRCRHCGYDFSLLPVPSIEDGPPLDFDLRPVSTPALDETPALALAGDQMRARPESSPAPPERAAPESPASRETELGLPLFAPGGPVPQPDPLLRFPVQPRPPLAVRRAPDAPRVRPPVRPTRRESPPPDPVLEFDDDPAPPAPRRAAPSPAPAEVSRREGDAASGAFRRLVAAGIDLSILLGIDAAVVYFTLRMTALTASDWRLLPAAPLLAFLFLVKLAYFFAFTAVGGQTIGKMAVGIRVVSDDSGSLDGSRVLRRTVVGACSALIAGLGFLPALVGEDRRALHDRVARTRVILL